MLVPVLAIWLKRGGRNHSRLRFRSVSLFLLIFNGGVGANGLVAGNYFSFPCFEDFEEWKEAERRNRSEERDVP